MSNETLSFNDIMSIAGGNPGAMTAVMGLVKATDPDILLASSVILPKLKEYNIKGTDVYVLWSDISNKDYSLMAHLCNVVPKDELITACSKQDYSGYLMLDEYIKEFKK